MTIKLLFTSFKCCRNCFHRKYYFAIFAKSVYFKCKLHLTVKINPEGLESHKADVSLST